MSEMIKTLRMAVNTQRVANENVVGRFMAQVAKGELEGAIMSYAGDALIAEAMNALLERLDAQVERHAESAECLLEDMKKAYQTRVDSLILFGTDSMKQYGSIETTLVHRARKEGEVRFLRFLGTILPLLERDMGIDEADEENARRASMESVE